MPSRRQSAIAGVAADSETTIMTVYPSISLMSPGRFLGRLYDSLDVRVMGIKPTYVFALMLSPVSVLMYFWLKVFGFRYVLTNRSVQKWNSLGNRRASQVSLTDIAQVAIHEEPGQAFYKAADIYLLGKAGERLMVLQGVPYAAIFRQTILEARDSRMQTAASLETIRARG